MHKHILYLASGSSRRFGSNKLLHPLDGKPMYLWGLETLNSVAQKRNDCDVTVVSRYKTIRERASFMGFHTVDSPGSEMGISHTIRAGIASLKTPGEDDYLLFMVADQPYLTESSIERLLDLAETGVICGSLSYEGCPGNPTLFSIRLIPELLTLQGDTGGRAVLRQHECVYIEANSGKELEDIDTK